MVEIVTKEKMFPLLRKACPDAYEAWQEHRKDYGDLPYMEIAVFARQIVESFEKDATDYFADFFALIEQFIVDGDEDVRGLAIVGFLEALQTNASWKDFGPVVFVQWLGPRSLVEWQNLEGIWEGKKSLADVIREERK